MAYIEDVTLLITHYNRSSSLERLLNSFKELDIRFKNIVVSDDGSKQVHLKYLEILKYKYQFTLVTTPKNKGLGNNINKGQDEIRTDFTLYVQEDFVPKPLFKEKLGVALEIMRSSNDFDTVRFYAYFNYPFLKPFKGGFSEMIFSPWPWYFSYRKFYYYSDHPHLRRTNFFEKFGRYPEGIPVERTEYKMMMAYIKNNGKSLFYTDFKELFIQENSSEEPSTVKRNYWRETPNPLVVATKHIYRFIRFNLDYLTQKKFKKTIDKKHVIN